MSKQRLKRLRVGIHRFVLVVENFSTRRNAEWAVLAAFATRQPDGCKFYLRKKAP